MPQHSDAIGTYFLPVIPSMEGVDSEVNKGMQKLLGRFGDIGKKSGANLGRGIGDGLKATQAEVDKAASAYEKLRDKAADALDKIGVEEKKLAKARAGGKEDMIAAAEARLAKSRRDGLRASKEAEASHSSLLSVQSKLGSGAGDLGGKLGALGGVTASLGPAMAALGAAAAGAAVAGIAMLGAGAVVATRQLYDLGAQWDDISDSLRIKTGATGGALDGLESSVKRLGSSVPVSLASLGEVVAETSRSLRLTGPELDAVAGTIANLGRMTGENVDVRQLGKAFRAFGVDAKDQVGALDQLFNAGQQTGIGVNELVANVLKGGPALRQLGLGFGESAALATQFEEAGLDGNRMLGSLTKGLAVMADKGLTGGKSFQQLIGRVQELTAAGRESDAMILTNQLFGKKAGGEFFEAIRSGALDLAALSTSMTSTGETIAQAAEGTADWSERWQLLKNEAVTALEPLGAVVFDFVNEKLGALADWVSTHHDEIIDAFVTIGQTIVSVGQFALENLGQMISGLGELIIPIGNVVGSLRKADAWLAEATGDSERAAQFREQSEAAYGWGEGLRDAGQKISDFATQGDKLKEELAKLGEQAKTTADGTAAFGDTAATAGTNARSAVDGVTSLFDAMNQPLIGGGFAGQFSDTMSQLPGLLGGAAGALPTGPTPPGGGLLGGAGGAAGRTGSESGLKPNSVAAKHAIEAAFPEIQSIGGWRPPDGYNEHFSGQALDVMIPNWNSSTGKAYGDKVAQYLLSNASALGVDYVLWQQRQWNADGTSSAMTDRGSPTQNHMDHVHAHTVNTPNLPGAQAAKPPTPSTTSLGAPSPTAPAVTGLGSTPAASALPAIPAPSTSPINLGANDISQQMVNAFGPEYKPGIGTPGLDEEGNPGYYRTDPRELAQAARRVEDSQLAIADADQRVLDAKTKLAELEEENLATAEQRAQAARDITRAEQAAERTRQDALWAQQDANEAAKGRFTQAKKADKTKKDKNGKGGGDLDGIGGIFGSFLKETFGLDGSLFPDISNLMPVQMAGTLLGALKDPIQAAIDGGQMPDAGDPFGAALDGGSATSGLPFGMIPGVSSILPDLNQPAAGIPGMHMGSAAAPGPVNNSTNVNIYNPQGDENSIADRTRRTIMRTPRMGTYTPPATVGGG